MSDWPTEFTIRSRMWTIEYVHKDSPYLIEPGDDPEDYCIGICRADQRKIWICLDQSPGSMRDTLVHELLHGVYSTMPGVDHDDEEAEENWVLAMTEAFFEIVQNSTAPWWLED